MRKTTLALIALLWAIPAHAAQESYLILNSTPDIAVAATSTPTTFVPGGIATGPGQYAAWVFIRPDCTHPVYFGFNVPTYATDAAYPLRLSSDEAFSAPFRIRSVGASPDSTSVGSDCTITLFFGKE